MESSGTTNLPAKINYESKLIIFIIINMTTEDTLEKKIRSQKKKKKSGRAGGLEQITTSEYVTLVTGEKFLRILSRILNGM